LIPTFCKSAVPSLKSTPKTTDPLFFVCHSPVLGSCPFSVGPVTLRLPVTTSIPAGTYRELEFQVHKPTSTPAENAVNGLLSGTAVGDTSMFNQAMNPSVPSLETGDLGTTTPGYQTAVNASFPASIPSIAAANNLPSVPGPATTAATTQQAISPSANVGVSAAASPSATGGFFNKGTIIGGLLGGAVAGPVGGILGGLLGNKVNQGGLSGLFGGSAPMSINPIGGGMANLGSIWGGGLAAGTQGVANNGDHVTSLGGGWTAVTNKYGVTTGGFANPTPQHLHGITGTYEHLLSHHILTRFEFRRDMSNEPVFSKGVTPVFAQNTATAGLVFMFDSREAGK